MVGGGCPVGGDCMVNPHVLPKYFPAFQKAHEDFLLKWSPKLPQRKAAKMHRLTKKEKAIIQKHYEKGQKEHKTKSLDLVLVKIIQEYKRAASKFGTFNSAHEGIAILREEYRELEDEVFWGTKSKMEKEAIQVGAMAIRFLVDCCGFPNLK